MKNQSGILYHSLQEAREAQMNYENAGYHAIVKEIPGKGSIWFGGGNQYSVIMDEDSWKRFEDDLKSGKLREYLDQE